MIPKKIEFIEIAMHVAFWVLFLWSMDHFFSFTEEVKDIVNGVEVRYFVHRSALKMILLRLPPRMIFFYVNALVLLRQYSKTKNFKKYILSIILLYVLLFWVEIFTGYLYRPDQFEFTIKGIVDYFIVPNSFIYVLMFGVSTGLFFSKAWLKSEQIKNILIKDQLLTEIKFLKSQINPHFLFNTLNNLFSIAQAKKNDELADAISKLSSMMRYMLYESDAGKVMISKEVQYLLSYIELYKLRFKQEELNFTFTYNKELDELMIAPMIFICFVENAFKHGIAINKQSDINISLTLKNNQILFVCENANYNYINKLKENDSGIGLENIRRRLSLIYPENHSLQIDESPSKYSVVLKIDL